MPRVIGLTGGIASGKSAVARTLRALGVEVIDADHVAREIVEPGQPALAAIAAAFGPDMLASDGTLDRKKLGARVFADPDARRRLNAITHPRIGAETARRIAEAGARGVAALVYEAALLVENGIYKMFDGLIVVACDEATQLARLRARDGLSDEEARQRVAAQLPLRDKIAAADWVIDNSGAEDDLPARVAAVWSEARHGRAGRPAT